MADRNEIFRIILEGRDKLSKELDTVRRASDSLDKSLQKLKRNKPDEFPLFGGGKASRGAGGQFIKKEEIAALDKVRQKIDDINRSINILKRNRIKEGEFALFGGGRAVRGDDGRFIRVQDVTLLEKAKNRLDAIDKALVRIRTRVRRGPLTEDEVPGFGATRLTKTDAGQFARAADLTLLQRFNRELAVANRHIRNFSDFTKRGFLSDARSILDATALGVVKLDQTIGRLITRLRRSTVPGFGGTRVGRDEKGQFVKVEDISLLEKATAGFTKLDNAVKRFRAGPIREVQLFFAGGTRVGRGEGGRFVRVEEVNILEKARGKVEQLSVALQKLKTRIVRGPLIEGEVAGAGATRLVRGESGRFARAQDLTLLQRIGREISVVGRGIREIHSQTRAGLILGVERSIAQIRRLDNFITDVARKAADFALGAGKTRTGVDSTTGRFISVPDGNAFNKFVQAVVKGGQTIVDTNQKIADSTKRAREDVIGGFRTGFDVAGATQRFIDEKVKNSREEVRIEKDRIKELQELAKLELSDENDRERKALFERLENLREADRLEIREKRKLIKEARADGDVDRKEELEDEIAAIQRARRLRESEEKAELTAVFQRRRANQRTEFVGQLRAVDAPDVETIEKEALEDRKRSIDAIDGSLKRMGARAGLAFGDLVRGVRSARSGIKDMDRDIRLVNNAFTRFGFAVGQIFKNFGQLVNLRWLFLTGVLSTFFTILVQVGTALVAVASSAIQAGAALGGAFAAGVAQALPVVGLLAAALSSFNKVLDQVKVAEKLDLKARDNIDSIRDASQRFADAQYSLRKAMESVGDAQFAVQEANEGLRDSYRDVARATEDLKDAKIQAARDIVDANLEEKDAALSLAEAELGVLEAKKKLREEERKGRGSNDIDDARAALKEAQERLKIAKTQQDESEISSAQQQVTIAEQNLNAVLDSAENSKTELKDAQLGVKRAELTLEQARVRNKRARQDAAQARKDGVEGSEVVTSAQQQLKQAIDAVSDAQRSVLLSNRNVRDSLHQVSVAQREVAEARKEESDARKGQTQADKDAQAAFADLAPAEKKLFNSLQRLRDTFKKVFVGSSEKDGILGPITEAIARFADTLTRLLLDPEIQRAAQNLADAIAAAFDQFRQFVESQEFKDAMLFFTAEAADNIPRVVQGMLNLARAFFNIARAATPIFNRLLEGTVGLTDKFKGFTSQAGETRRPEEGQRGVVSTINESGLDRFLASAEKHLDSWLRLSGAIINLIDAIANSGAAVGGQTLIDKLTDKLNEFADFFRDNPEAVQEFFDKAVVSIENLTRVLGRLTKVLVVAFSSDEFLAFAEVMAEIVIPGLVGLIFFLGKVSQALLFLLEIPIVGDILKFALAFLVFEKGLNKLFPVTQKLTQAVKSLVGVAFRAGRVLLAPGGFRAALDVISYEARKLGTRLQRLAVNLVDFSKRAAQGALTAATKLKDAFVAMGNAALGAASKIGKALYASLAAFAKLIAGAVVNAIRILRLNIRLLLLSTGIGALILAGVLLIENWEKVKAAATRLWKFLVGAFKRVTDWVRENWKKILIGALLAPLLPAGAVLLGIYKFRDRIIGVFQTIGTAIKNAFKSAFDWIREQFTNIIDFMKKAYDKLPGPVKTIIRGAGALAEKAGKAAGAVAGAANAAKGIVFRAKGGTIPGTGKGDTVPAMLTPGEWVLNDEQQRHLANVMGTTVAQVKAVVFGTNSSTPPGQARMARANRAGNKSTARNNGLGKKVQYYGNFNLVSQEDPDGNTVWFIEMADGSFGQVTARDATKIQNSHGTWIPGYVKRSTAGFKENIQRVVTGGISGFSMGGIVTAPGVQRFARGGIVQAPGHGGTSRAGNVINQNFDVKTQGETDWGYVMRLGAIHAQESF